MLIQGEERIYKQKNCLNNGYQIIYICIFCKNSKPRTNWKPFLGRSSEWNVNGIAKFKSNLAIGCLKITPIPIDVECF